MATEQKLPPAVWVALAVGVVGVSAAAMMDDRSVKKFSRSGSLGRHYVANEWLEFFTEPGRVTVKMHALAKRFTAAVLRVYAPFQAAHPVDDDALAYRTYASLVGHGIGLWDGELLDEDVGRRVERAMKADPVVHKLGHQLDDDISMARERGEDRDRRARDR